MRLSDQKIVFKEKRVKGCCWLEEGALTSVRRSEQVCRDKVSQFCQELTLIEQAKSQAHF